MTSGAHPERARPGADQQPALRSVTLWAARYATRALPVFEARHADSAGPREAIAAALAFANGGTRDKALRMAAWKAHKAAGLAQDPLAKYAARAAMLTAAVAYTHTDLTEGTQGITQAQHLLGPVVYAALALGDPPGVIVAAAAEAPEVIIRLLRQFPRQPGGRTILRQLYQQLDVALRDRSQP